MEEVLWPESGERNLTRPATHEYRTVSLPSVARGTGSSRDRERSKGDRRGIGDRSKIEER